MKTTYVNKLFLLVFILMMSLTMLSCSSDDDDDIDGLIYNQTAYRTTVDFLGIKIVTVTPGALYVEKGLEKDNAYPFRVTFYDNAGNVLEVIDNTLIIDSNTGDREIAGQTCSWFIRISGEPGDFSVISAS